MQRCPKCGTEFEGKFCPECGEAWQEEKTCPNCGAKLAGSAKFCNECGYSFAKQPEPPAKAEDGVKSSEKKQPSAGTGKFLALVSMLPMILFGVFAVMIPFLFLAPVAVTPGSSFMGVAIPSETYGNVYEIGNFDGSSLSATLTAMIVLMACALFVALVIGIAMIFLKFRQKRVILMGKSVLLCNVLTGVGYVVFFALAAASCALLAQISQEDGGLGLIQAGAAPILSLVFPLFGCVIAVGCVFMTKYLRNTYPSLAAEREARIAEAKPTSFEVWLGVHKKATRAIVAVLVLAIAAGVIVPVALANRYNGVYYAYNCETEEYDKTRFYKLTGGAWEDEDGTKGEITFDGDKATLTYDPSGGMDKTGSSAVTQEGELHGDVLKINGTVYVKEGHRHTTTENACACGHLNLDYIEVNGGYCVNGPGGCQMSNIVIPPRHNGKPVISIGERAFEDCSSLESITIPASVTLIGEEAFWDCSSLQRVTFEGDSKLTSIGERAFHGCSSLETITIPEDVTLIGEGAFYNCDSLTSITIPASVTSIGGYAFYGCGWLQSVTFEGDSQLTSIGSSAFSGCSSLESITIPEGVTSIGNYAFSGCRGLQSVTFEGNSQLTSIGNYAFWDCSSLQSVTFEGNSQLTSIGNYAFSGCRGLQSVTFEGNSQLTSIGEEAFWGCDSLETVYITDLEAWCGIDFGDDYANPLRYAHHLYVDGQEVTDLHIPDGVTEIKQYAFNGGAFTSVIIPASVTSIGDGAFSYCSSLTSITIPENVTSIGRYAFYDCDSLISITIPASVTSIGDGAFSYCSSLTSVQFERTDGWKVSAYFDMRDAQDVTVSNPLTAAGYLTNTYYDYYWKRY